MDFRLIVLDELKKRGISRYRLAKETGIGYSTIREWLAQKHDLPSEKLQIILKYLKLEIKISP
jgi:transposase